MNIPLSKPDIGDGEIESVTRVLRSGRLSLGPELERFEERFAAYIGTRFAVATNSGTSALHLCVKAFGIGAEDEVLTTPFSFVASANCLLYERALPAFADIDPATLNIDPAEIRAIIAADYVWLAARRHLINRQTGRALRAILPVHVFGLPCDMSPILEVAREFDLRVIEDACEALGAEYRGRRVGTFGDAAVFAFYPNKQITAAEGGMIVTNDPHIAKTCRSLRNQGRDEHASWLSHSLLGYNYRLSELHCALGSAQLERINDFLAARERLARRYTRALQSIPQISLPREFLHARRSWFTYAIQLRGASSGSRDRLIRRLRERSIASQAYFPAIHRQPYFRDFAAAPLRPLTRTESASERCLALPLFSSMKDEEVDCVCAALREILDGSKAISRRAERYTRLAAS